MLVINSNPSLYRRYQWSAPVAFVLGAIFNLVAWCARIACSLIHRRHTRLPPIQDGVIAESVLVLADKIRNQQITSTDLVSAYIKRIQSTDGILNYLVDNRFGEAMIEAQNIDKFISSGTMTVEELKRDKPFLGVPFTTKDGIAIKGLHQTVGLPSRRKHINSEDSEVVRRLKNAGAIPLGLTNVPEMLSWWEAFNQLYGRTDNPYDNTRTVGGSSGGEGCIQAVAGSAFGLGIYISFPGYLRLRTCDHYVNLFRDAIFEVGGSDSAGSIRIPSHMNGVFGHKPTRHSVSLEGHFPPAETDMEKFFWSIGPLVRRASDLKPVLKVISNDQIDFDKPVKLSEVKVYFQKESGNVTSVGRVDIAVDDAINKAVSHLKAMCNVLPVQVMVEKFSLTLDIWTTAFESGTTATYTQSVVGSDSILAVISEMVKCALGRSEHTFISLLNCFLLPRKKDMANQRDLLKMRQELMDELTELLGDDGVLLYPTNGTAAPYHDEIPALWGIICYPGPMNMLGLPATHIPMGLNKEGLPVGFQVIAGWNNDRLCLAIAEEMDKTFGGWRDPSKVNKNL